MHVASSSCASSSCVLVCIRACLQASAASPPSASPEGPQASSPKHTSAGAGARTGAPEDAGAGGPHDEMGGKGGDTSPAACRQRRMIRFLSDLEGSSQLREGEGQQAQLPEQQQQQQHRRPPGGACPASPATPAAQQQRPQPGQPGTLAAAPARLRAFGRSTVVGVSGGGGTAAGGAGAGAGVAAGQLQPQGSNGPVGSLVELLGGTGGAANVPRSLLQVGGRRKEGGGILRMCLYVCMHMYAYLCVSVCVCVCVRACVATFNALCACYMHACLFVHNFWESMYASRHTCAHPHT